MPYVTTIHDLTIKNGEASSKTFHVQGADVVGVAIAAEWDNDAYLGLDLADEEAVIFVPVLTKFGYYAYIRRIFIAGYYAAPPEFSGIHGFARLRSISPSGSDRPQSGDVVLKAIIRSI